MRSPPRGLVIGACVLFPFVTSGCGSSEDAAWVGPSALDEPGVRDGAGGDVALPSADLPPPATAPLPEPSRSVEPSDVPDARAVDPAAAAALCAALGEDRLEQNLRAVNRLGLEMSSVRVEGTLGNPVTDVFGERHAVLTIEKVWVGPTFLEGAQTLVGLSSGELAGLKLPGSYIVGFGTTIDGFLANPYPVQVVEASMSVWDKEVIIPSAERDHFADLLSYGIEGEPLVAVVQVVARDGYKSLRVVETLAGNLPGSITMPWLSTPYVADFPEPGEQNYLATFRRVYLHEGTGRYLGDLLDFRPYDATVREMAQRALAAPRAPRDLAALRRAADEYRLAWAVHRSSFVAATRIVGAARETCAGYCDTYFAYDVLEDLRGGNAARVLLDSGVTEDSQGNEAYPSERCGDTAVVAVSESESDAASADTAVPFACGEPSDWPHVDRHVLPRVNARWVDSEATRAQVRGWLRSPEPRHLMRREADRRAPFALGPDAVWSRPMSEDQALVTAPLVWISVVGLSESTGRLVVETSFSSWPNEPAPRQRLELDAECNDQLAAFPGEWLVPLVMDDGAGPLYEGDAFIIPGVVLPNFGYINRIVDKLRFTTNADEIRHSL